MKTWRAVIEQVALSGMVGVAVALLFWAVSDSCRPPTMGTYAAQQAAAEKRAEAFKEAGHWTPTAMRAFAKSLKPNAVLPQQALAEMGIVVLEDLNVSTVQAAVGTMAATVENCGKRP